MLMSLYWFLICSNLLVIQEKVSEEFRRESYKITDRYGIELEYAKIITPLTCLFNNGS
jgi:hypothetical protein